MYGSKLGITSANAKNQKIYGVNGTFYHTIGHKIPDCRLKVYGVAIANGKIADIKQANQDGGVFGGDNNHTDLDSFMLGTYNMIEGSDVFIAKQRNFPFNAETKNVYVSDCRWAIGGHTLNLTSNFTSKTQFNNNLSASARNYNSDTQRTFMGQKNNMVYLCTVHSACRMYDE